MIQGITTALGGLEEDAQLLAHVGLAHVFSQRARAQADFNIPLFQRILGIDEPFFVVASGHNQGLMVDCKAWRINSSEDISGLATARTMRLASCGL